MFRDRLDQIRKKLLKEKLDAVLVSATVNITYLTGYANFSKEEREAYLLIGKDFGYIITDGRYKEAIKKTVPHLTLFERGHKQSTEDLFKKHKKEIKKIGIEEDNLTISEHKILTRHFKNTKHFDVGNLRSIKTTEEIEKIEKACRLGDKAFEYILRKIKPGVSEKEIAFEIEFFVKKNGANLSFPSIVAFGKDSSVPHHHTSDKRLTIHDKLILLDFGVKLDNYCSDMTRTVFYGKPDNKQEEIYKTVLASQQKAINYIKSGKKKASEVDQVARDYIISQGYPDIPHSLGHGIGLEVHEHPSLSSKSKDILKEGMVFSIEPGIYLPGFGGVRIEDLFVLETDGLKQLTNSSKLLTALK